MLKTLRRFSDLGDLEQGFVLACGVFDGVHRGHRAVFEGARKLAQNEGGLVGVLTFDPHPAAVLRPQSLPALLSPGEEKLKLLEEEGLEFVLELVFDQALACLSAEEFLRELRGGGAGRLRGIACGADWTFGAGRQGDVKFLQEVGAEGRYGKFAVCGVEPVLEGGEVISSTRIRRALAAGRVEEAAVLLGRNFKISGRVVEGAQLGRQLGFPTANVQYPDGKALPGAGVYEVGVEVGGNYWLGAANLGRRPTVEGGEGRPILEVHLVGFGGDLYGRAIGVEFRRFLRAEKKFSSLEELREQIGRDVAQVEGSVGEDSTGAESATA